MVESTVLDENQVSAQLVAEIITEACKVQPTSTRDGKVIVLPWRTQFRRRAGTEIRLIHGLFQLESEKYLAAEEADQQSQLEQLAAAMRAVLMETPDQHVMRIEFIRSKATNHFYASSWYNGWGDESMLPSTEGSGSKRTPTQTSADGRYSIDTALAAVIRDDNATIRKLSDGVSGLGLRTGLAEGQLGFYKAEYSDLKREYEELEKKVDRQHWSQAFTHGVDKMVEPLTKLAEKPGPELVGIIKEATLFAETIFGGVRDARRARATRDGAAASSSSTSSSASSGASSAPSDAPPTEEEVRTMGARTWRLMQAGAIKSSDLRKMADAYDAANPPPKE